MDIDELVQKVEHWHAVNDHRAIIEVIGSEPSENLDYNLSLRLAQSYLGIANPMMKDYEENLSHAEQVLLTTKELGRTEAEWCYTMGKVLRLQNREAEAFSYHKRALNLMPEENKNEKLRETIVQEINNRTVVEEMSIQRVADFYDAYGWEYESNFDSTADSPNGFLSATFKNCTHGYVYDGTTLVCEYILEPDPPGELYRELVLESNTQNSIREFPRMFIYTTDDARVRLIATHNVVAKSGLTQNQLVDHLLIGIQSSRKLFEEIESTYPEIHQESDDQRDSTEE